MQARFNGDWVVDTHGPMVYRLAYARTGTTADAEDIYQEVFLRYARHQNELTDAEHLKAWLLRVTINCCAKHHASPWQQRTQPLNEQLTAPEPADGSDVLAAVLSLPDKYRTVVHLHYFEGYSTAEIAQLTQTRDAAVRKQLERARGLLRAALKGAYHV